uniref:Uncharacterized protein n=1 Tax=Hyaloperonospora arabidopsidis (strain Emoy2) TaxID=559515 RepID=M4BU87_HYAAE
MHCHYASCFDSSPSLAAHPRSCNMLELESSDASPRFYLGGRRNLWDVNKCEFSSLSESFLSVLSTRCSLSFGIKQKWRWRR